MRWQSLLRDLEKELEQMNTTLRSLEIDNLRMREVVQARPRLELSRPLSTRPCLDPISVSQSLDLKGTPAQQSWSLALSSVPMKKEAFARRTSGSSPSRSILKSVSFHDRTHGDGSEVSDIKSLDGLDGLDSDTMTSEGKAQKAPVRGILKKNSTYGVSISPEGPAGPARSTNSNTVIGKGKSSDPTASRLSKEDKGGFAILRGQKTKVFMMQKPWYVINPDSTLAATVWQCITSAALIWIALVTPLQVGLLKMEVDWVFVTSVVVDAIFFIDMLLQFCTTYARRTPRGDEWEVRIRKIIVHYCSTWFVLDFVTLIPFELLAMQMGDAAFEELTMIKVIRVLRLLKLTRLARSSRLAQRLEAPISLPYQHLALLRCVLVLVLVCHWLASLWAATIGLVPDGTPTWIDDIAAVDEGFGIDTRGNPFRVYVASFYFCSYTMTSVGYGDIGPKNILERMACTVIVIGAGLSWACVLGEVCAIVAEMNAATQDFRKNMHHLNGMMGDQGLPGELQKRLRTFFLQNRHQVNFATHQKLLKNMSPQLQAEVSTVVNLPWLRKVPFFNNFLMHIEALGSAGMDSTHLHACIADVSQELEMRAYAQRESFNNVQVLHILAKGLVVLDTRVAANGAVWGEDFALADVPLIQRVAGFALTYVEVLCLKRERFMAVIEKRRTLCPELGQIVRRYCVRIAVYRGILAEARRLRLLKVEETRTEAVRISVENVPEIPGVVLDD